MPEMDGLTLQQQRAHYRNAPLIFISGSSGIDEAVAGLRMIHLIPEEVRT